jgi:hypothetical protein
MLRLLLRPDGWLATAEEDASGRPASQRGSLSEALPLLLRLAEAKMVVFLWGPCGTALAEPAGMAKPALSSSVAIGEEQLEECLLYLLFFAA